jgi:hypothetical protein
MLVPEAALKTEVLQTVVMLLLLLMMIMAAM